MADEVRKRYQDQEDKLKKFLQEFEASPGEFKYIAQMQAVANRQRRIVTIDLDDLEKEQLDDLVREARLNTKRYITLFSECIDQLLPEPSQPYEEEDVFDIMLQQRLQVQRPNENGDEQGPAGIPADLRRRFEVRITPLSRDKPASIRSVKSVNIGQLVSVRAMVARVSDVKPLAKVVTYTCEQCGFEVYQEVTARSFMPLDKCPTESCQQYKSNSKLLIQTRGSKFVKFQELKVQELPDQVPTGHIPRMMTVQVVGELSRSCSPGDEVTISGVYLPVPFTGYRAIKAGLTADTYLEAMSITQAKQRYKDLEVDDEMINRIEQAAAGSNTYSKLASSLAPEIFGHDDVKKALLLQLVGGCNRKLKDGLAIRGDMHLCLMGDPGVAKSQLLKHIAKLAPRGVYTTGKGSSGVGLTASVLRDQFTNEMVLEGGALVLADQGVCAIDEFDKMEESDRTAIHEVMEQQTVSIAKAGITTTLNARTSVLAAANPAYGRYNMRRSPSENINLPQALLSRFDLLFLLVDRVNESQDTALARHVTHVHRFSSAPDVDDGDVFDSNFLKSYIAQARTVEPVVPDDLQEYIVGAYISMRCDEEPSDSRNYFFTTARTLLSILRLAQSLARLRFSPEVQQSDVDEGIRLMFESKRSLYDEANPEKRTYDPASTIFEIAKNIALQQEVVSVRVSDLEQRVLMKGFTRTQMIKCIDEYAGLDVWMLEQNDQFLRFVDDI